MPWKCAPVKTRARLHVRVFARSRFPARAFCERAFLRAQIHAHADFHARAETARPQNVRTQKLARAHPPFFARVL